MDVDLRVVAVKLTNRFCEIERQTKRKREKESTSTLLKYTKAEQKRYDDGEQGIAAAGGQEIAAKQAWRGIKG